MLMRSGDTLHAGADLGVYDSSPVQGSPLSPEVRRAVGAVYRTEARWTV